MKTDRYANLFATLAARREGAYIPFVTLGDPDGEESLAILHTLAENGADALELGIPFSDPIADGPVIQTAANRALAAGTTPRDCFEIVRRFRQARPEMPIGLLVYANLVIGRGIEEFYSLAATAGVDSVLVADAPSNAAAIFAPRALAAGVAPVYIAPPNADDAKLREIARLTRGYTYFLGRTGVTGADREMDAPASANIALLKEAGAPPIVVGFGISRPEHVRTALAAGADGAIAGSATVAIIERNIGRPAAMHEELATFTREMKSATKGIGESRSA